MNHYLIQQNGFILNVTTGDYARDCHKQPICLTGTLSEAIAWVENECGGTWEIE